MCPKLIYTIKTFMFLLLLIILSGCGKIKNSDGVIHLVCATPASESTSQLLLSTIEQFEAAHTNIEVQLLEIPGDYYQKLLVMIAGKTAPDIMWMGQSFAEFAVKDVFLDINDRIKNDPDIDITNYNSKVLGWYRINGKQLSIPYGIDVEFIGYNKDLFDKYHVPYPRDDWNVDDFIKTAKALTKDTNNDGKIDQYGFSGRLNMSCFDAAIISDDGQKALCNSPQMLDYIKFNINLVFKEKICPPPNSDMFSSADKFSVFHHGKIAMMRFFTFDLPYLRDQCADMRWDIVVSPVAKRKGYWASSNAYLISADTKHPDASWLLFKEFISRRFQLALASETMPANLDVAKYAFEHNTQPPDNIKCLLGTVDYLYPYPRVANLQEIMRAYWLDLSKVYSFYDKPSMRVSPEEAMKRAESRINEIIKRNKERNK